MSDKKIAVILDTSLSTPYQKRYIVIDKETGMLVSDKNTTAYVKALEYIRKDPESAKKFANNATRLLKKRHSWEAFIETIKEDF